MSLLTVVRHGQASFLSDNYDKLSPTGEQQARLLGEYWLERGVTFDRICYGPAERQINTGEIIGGLFRKAGRPWPEPRQFSDLDEFPAEQVVRTFLPELCARHQHLAEWTAEARTSKDRAVLQRLFDRILREVSLRWLRGEVGSPDIPTWHDFCHRVEAVIRGIVAETPKSSSVALFTSGGPTAATTRVALGLTYESTLELTWSPRNASFSEFLFTGDRFSLSTFNLTPHLTSPDLLTYR